ncbi:MAG: protein kinase [Phycisphaerales bacterium]|nr:MAG: protein kinase [Phycisphaerales bacterium]
MSQGSDNQSTGDGGPAPDAAAPHLTVLGDFELGREIGRGGMGTVYEAWQRSLKRTVAVKVLGQQVSSSPAAVLRFQREAQAAAKLRHPNIIPIFALGEEEGTYYYAMELIDGPGLNAIIAESRDRQTADTATSDLAETLPLGEAAESGDGTLGPTDGQPQADGSALEEDSEAAPSTLPDVRTSEEHFTTVAGHIADIADALGYAHRQGVIHRDIKPHNLVLGSDGKMSISDFGLARLAEQPGVTITGELIGSPLYMSPEQVKGEPTKVDHRTDICSLGSTMYEWLTLTPPYPGDTREQVISKILTSEPIPLRTHNPSIPMDLETICLKAIDRDRHRRYQKAEELRDDLRRFISNQPIRARRPSLGTRVTRFIARHQVASLAAATVLVAVGLGSALWSSQREVASQTAATEQADRVLDVFSKLPLEISGPLRVAEAAVPMLEGVIQSREESSGPAGNAQSEGANPATASTPLGIAQRAVGEFYQAIAPGGWPVSAEVSPAESSALVRLAVERWEAEPDVAVELLDAHLERQPIDFPARQLRTALRGGLGGYQEMLEDAEGLVRLRPEEPNAFAWRGLANLLLRHNTQSLSDLDQAAELGGFSPWTATLQGLALAQANRWIEAISAFDDALEAEPDLVVALLGRASARASLGNAVGAVTDLTRVIELEPENADTLALRGDRNVELQDYKAAERDYERAMEIAGQTPSMVVRYLFALSRSRDLMRRSGEEPQPLEDRDLDTEPVGSSDRSSSAGPTFDWLSRLLSPHHPWQPRVTQTPAGSKHISLRLGGRRPLARR